MKALEGHDVDHLAGHDVKDFGIAFITTEGTT
jgi:hypothetical protein